MLGGPLNTLSLVGIGVRVALGLSGVSVDDTMEVGADLVGSSGLGGVALSASSLEESSTLLSGTFLVTHCSFCVVEM